MNLVTESLTLIAGTSSAGLGDLVQAMHASTFENFSKAIVDEGLSLACGIWRDTWDDNNPLAAHARQFIERWAEAELRAKVNAEA